MSVSCCVIVKDEEQYLEQALQSIQGLVDEIIVVDTGSQDKTKAITKKYTKKIFDYAWSDNFSDARDFSLRQATKDWILVVDADEVISPRDHERIQQLTANANYDAYSFVQVSYTNDQSMLGFIPIVQRVPEAKKFSGFIQCNIIRLFRNRKNIHFANPVHESVDASIPDKTRILQTSIPIHHYQFEKGEAIHQHKQLSYLNIYEKNMEHFENKAKVFRDMGIINYNFKKDYIEAIKYFKRSLEINPNNLKTYLGLALAYLRNKWIDEAMRTLEAAEKINPHNADIQKLKAYLGRARQLRS